MLSRILFEGQYCSFFYKREITWILQLAKISINLLISRFKSAKIKTPTNVLNTNNFLQKVLFKCCINLVNTLTANLFLIKWSLVLVFNYLMHNLKVKLFIVFKKIFNLFAFIGFTNKVTKLSVVIKFLESFHQTSFIKIFNQC